MNVHRVINPSRDDWNRFITAQPGATIYQSYEWGEIRRTHGWEPHYLVLERGGEWIAAALILAKRLPAGLGTVLYSPRGPIVTGWEGAVPALIEAVGILARACGAMFWRVEPPVHDEEALLTSQLTHAGFVPVAQEWSYWNTPKYEMHLDLSPGEQRLFEALGRKNRWKVRCGANHVNISVGTADEDVETFHSLLQRTAEKKAIMARGLEYYRQCRDILGKSDMLAVFVARKETRPVAAGITTRYGAVARLLHMSNDYSEPNSGWALQWEMIRWAIIEGCRVYDFAGTATHYPPRETDKGYGVYQFKHSFGAQIVRWYGYADYVFRPLSYQTFRLIERKLPYGERLFIEWPKQLFHRWRSPPSRTEPSMGTAAGRNGPEQS